MVNYYELLGLEKDASTQEIETAIKKMRRVWNSRANNPSAEIRAEAEQNVKNIADAERILLNTATREQYDIELATAPSPVITSSDDGLEDWQERVVEMCEIGNYTSAYTFLQSILQREPLNSQALLLLGMVCSDTDRDEEALTYLLSASQLNDENPLIYKYLGFSYDAIGEHSKALDAFKRASILDPAEDIYKIFCTSELRTLEKYKDAYEMIEPLYQNNKNNADIKLEYEKILLLYAKSCVSCNSASDKPIITNSRQLQALKSLESDIRHIESKDSNMRQLSSELLEAITKAETKRVGGPTGLIVSIAIGVLVLAAMAGSFIIGLLIAGAVIGIYYATQTKPGYEWNFSESSNETRRTGLQ